MKYSVLDNYDALPEELRKELTTLNDVDIKILKLLKSEGLLTIDNLLIGIFLEYKQILTHEKIDHSIKKMAKLGAIHTKKGLYFINDKVDQK